ncbi:hypothetical protein ACQCT5_04780 [Sutcliffiella halmapala]
MPKIKTRKLIIQKETRGEKKVGQLRDKRGQYTSLDKLRREETELKQRSIKVIRVKNSYGTYLIKQRLIPDDIRNLIILSVAVGLLISIL